MNSRTVADQLMDAGCYINTSKTNELPIVLPDGSQVSCYLSCRRLLAQPKQRELIESSLVALIRDTFPDVELIVGVATAGIPWAYGVAIQLGIPMAYVRSSKKGYGVGSLVEGAPLAGVRAVVIDDVLFTGKSIQVAVQALTTEKNIITIGVVGIASLNGSGCEGYRKAGFAAHTLTDYAEIVDSAVAQHVISETEASKMRAYYQQAELVV